MKLKKTLQTLEGLEEDIAKLYEEAEDGTYVLKIEVEDPKLDEFRSNNRKLNGRVKELQKSLEELRNEFKDVDLDKYKSTVKLLDQLEADEERRLISEGNLEEVLDRRTSTMRRDFDTQLAAKDSKLQEFQAKLDATTGKLSSFLVGSKVDAVSADLGISPKAKAKKDILRRASETWKPHPEREDEFVAMDGESTLYGKDGDPLTMKEWAQNLVDEADFFFEEAGGGGGAGSGDSSSGKKRVNITDPFTFGENLEAIASGEIEAM